MAEDQAAMQDRLAAFLRVQMPGASDIAVFDLRRAASGRSRENWYFSASWKDKHEPVERKLVLRLDAEDPLLATDLETEFRVLHALADRVPFPTPRAYWLDRSGWLDRSFLIMEFCEGASDRNVIARSSIPLEERVRLAKQYTEIMAQMHRLDWEALGLSFLGVPTGRKGAAEAQVARWESLIADPFEPQPVLVEALYWLKGHTPEQKHIALVHGDFRPGNSLLLNGEVNAVLDWEMAHLGDPMEDLGWYTLPTNYDREHFLPGLYHHKEFYEDYEQLTGFEVDEDVVHYYRVVAAFKIIANFVSLGKKAIVPSFFFQWQYLLANLIGL